MTLAVILVLLAFVVYREAFHSKIQADLLNKLMSRNYHEFQVAQKVGVKAETFQAPKIHLDEVEDFNVMSGFGPL